MLLNRQVSVSQPLPTTGPAIAVSDYFYHLVCDLLGNRVTVIVMIRKRAKADEVFQTERFQDAVQVVQFNDDALLEESDGKAPPQQICRYTRRVYFCERNHFIIKPRKDSVAFSLPWRSLAWVFPLAIRRTRIRLQLLLPKKNLKRPFRSFLEPGTQPRRTESIIR